MCGTCTTVVDAAATNGVLIAAWMSNRWRARRQRRAGMTATDQAVDRWQHHADFLAALGHDPWLALGAPPAPPLAAPDRTLPTTDAAIEPRASVGA